MAVTKATWTQKSTGNTIHPETEVDQLKASGTTALASIISTLLKATTNESARSAISAAAASHSHSTGDITSFASSVIEAIGSETLAALGVSYSITTNGYICFGDLFGGLILQWKAYQATNFWVSEDQKYEECYQVITLPISFKNHIHFGYFKDDSGLFRASEKSPDHGYNVGFIGKLTNHTDTIPESYGYNASTIGELLGFDNKSKVCTQHRGYNFNSMNFIIGDGSYWKLLVLGY